MLPQGFTIGHWTAADAGTGCTVVLPPPGNVCGVDIRGSAPGSRELASLDTRRARSEVHGIVLAGASAFGLAAADGVMEWLEEHGIGFRAGPATIPIVPAAIIFDAAAFSAAVRPTRESGYAACGSASDVVSRGRVGAGAGATIGKWAGGEFRAPGGFGFASISEDGYEVAAIAVVNAFGDVMREDGSVLAGTKAANPSFIAPSMPAEDSNTVLAVVMTTASMTKQQAAFVASRGSDGITISIRPAHTRYDGDVCFAIAAPAEADERSVDRIGILATLAVASAIRDAVVS